LTGVSQLSKLSARVGTFLETYSTLMVGGGVALFFLGLRAIISDKTFKSDLGGALIFYGAFIVLRLAWAGLHRVISPKAEALLWVLGVLALAFGVIRSLVAVALHFVRTHSSVPIPKILRDFIDFTLYVIVGLSIVHDRFKFDLSGVLATSAVASIAIGLALQDTLGNLFAGLSIQVERPFQVGDFVTIRDYTGRVVQITWRATRIETLRREVITLPNSIMSKEAVRNFSRGAEPVGFDIYLGLSFETPPNVARAAVLEALKGIPNLLAEPPPRCRIVKYDESSIRYQVRYFVASFAHADNVMDEIYTRLWYRFRREEIPVAYPQRRVQLREVHEDAPRAALPSTLELLRKVDLFAMLSPDELEKLNVRLHVRSFGRGEKVIEEGQLGQTFYIVAKGSVAVQAKNEVEVSRLGPGQYFGEMSLLTGEPRAATVVAAEDAVLLELERTALSELFEHQPDLARQLSSQLAQRRTELNAVATTLPGTPDPAPEANRILDRLKQIFGLRFGA
jgi:small-conductance mechanosensitive channel/CRP-like cAMP-binding protein